ncbi:MAG TPA: cytochrome c biogenesis protein CcdA [Actinomycetales bacterium]|nr:cytochrome c biogenesis protein CcdA [Actinomycetales bacterium]
MDSLGATFASIVLDGSMLLAIPIAIVAGLVSFASPCVLPLVPGYLGYVTGMAGASSIPDGAPHRRVRSTTVWGAVLFVAGFTFVFVVLGVIAGSLGAALAQWQTWIDRVLGLIVVLLGVVFLGGFAFLQRERRLAFKPAMGLSGAPVLGMVFGLGWAPCIGPTFAAVLTLSLGGGSALRGGILAVMYCVGLGLPFIAVAFALERGSRVLEFLRHHRLALMRIGGAMLILIGLALVTGLWGAWVRSLQGLIGGFETVV